MEKDKHVMPDLSDTFAARVKKGAHEKKNKGVIFGADNSVIRRVDISETGSPEQPPEADS